MKIATQLLSTAPSTVSRPGVSPDNGADFQGVLTAAAAKGSSSDVAPQVKGKLSTQDAKLQTPEVKKKSVASDSTVADVPASGSPAPKQLQADAVVQVANSLPPAQEEQPRPSDQILNDAYSDGKLSEQNGSFTSSIASISTVAQLPTNLSRTGRTDQRAPDRVPLPASAQATPKLIPTGTERVLSNATSSRAGFLETRVAVVPSTQIQVAVPLATTIAPTDPVLPRVVTETASSLQGTAVKTLPASPATPPLAVLAEPVAASNTASAGRYASVVAPLPVGVAKTMPETPEELTPVVSAEPVAASSIAPASAGTFTAVVAPLPVAAAKTMPETPVTLPPAITQAPVVTETTVSTSPVTAAPNALSAPVTAAKDEPETFVAVSSGVPAAMVTAFMPVSSLPVTAAPAASTALAAAAKTAPATPHGIANVLSPAQITMTKAAAELPVAVSAVGIAKTVPALQGTVSQDVSPARVAAAKNPASPTSGSPVVLNAPVAAERTNTISQVTTPADDLATTVAAAPEIPAISSSQDVSPKTATHDPVANVSQSPDATNENPTITVPDAAPSASQQTVTAILQNVAAQVSLPDVGVVGALRSAPAIAANQIRAVGGEADTVKGTASRQTTPAVKGKLTSGTSVSGSRFGDGDSQTETAAVATGSSAPKMLVAPVSGNQGANQPANQSASVSGNANLQQVIQASPADETNLPPQSSQSVSVSGQAATQTISAQAVPDSQAMQGVSSAQLTQSMRSSEMKLGMQSAEFGNISISTSLNHQALSAQISIDHSELGRALAMHLPAIEEKIGSAYGVQAKVELRDSNNPSSSNDSGYSNSGQQSREQRQSQGGGSNVSPAATYERIAARASFSPVSTTATASRLDIRI